MALVLDGKSRDLVREECLRLRSMLEQVCPGYGKSLKPTELELELESEAPEGVCILWDAVGYSMLFSSRLALPTLKSGRKQVKNVLETWRSDVKVVKKWGGKEPSLEYLPARFRLVWMSKDQKRFLITDENPDDFDPPVHSVSVDAPGHRRVRDSYMRYVADALVMCGVSVGPTRCSISFSPPVKGPPLLPLLAPHVATLGEGVWSVTPSPAVGPMGEPNDFLAYTSLERFVSYVRGLAGHEITYTGGPRGDFVNVQGLSDAVVKGPGLRWFTWTFQTRLKSLAVGSMGGVAVWMEPTGPDTYTLRVEPEARVALVQWLTSQGAKVTYEESWKVYFAEPGGISFL